jgi:predicted site-specific integrase-resolvase
MTQPASLLTPGQVVEKLAAAGIEVSEESVRHWARTRKLPVVRLPSGRFYFRAEDVNAFLEPIEPGAA